MSFKGITWAGNVYEKFEAMCLEVEEAVYQDTVKYMENQVQKVGVSVKKFCSEVMDDLRPLSCVDPTSLDSDDPSHFTHDVPIVKKKPIQSLSKKENEEQVFSPQSPGIFIENISSEKSTATRRIGVNRRPIGIKRISRNKPPSEESSLSDGRSKAARRDASSTVARDETNVTSSSDSSGRSGLGEVAKGSTPITDDSIKMSSSQSAREDTSTVARDDTNVTSSSDMATPILDNVIEPPPSKKASLDESVRQMEDASDCISHDSDNKPSDERLKEDAESTSSSSGLHTEPTGTSMKGGSNPHDTEPCNKGLIASEDSFEMEFVENEEITDPRFNFEAGGKVRLEESCVLVEGDELHSAIQQTRKHKSYKKRIRAAISSKMKSRNDDKFGRGEKKQNLSAQDSVESDWEIL